MKSRVVYFCLEPLWCNHFVHELELIESDLDSGLEVHVVRPGSMMRFSDTDPWGDYARRLPSDLSRFRVGMSLLRDKVRVHSLDRLARSSPYFEKFELMDWPDFPSQEALDAFRFEGHDCGNAVRSSLISHTRNTAVDPSDYRSWVENALYTSVAVYLAARSIIETRRPDRVTVFNGRMATFRGVLRACQEAEVECLVHERGATLERVSLAHNTMPHDIFWVQREILRHWDESDLDDEAKREIGRRFYQRKRDKDLFNWTIFAASQEEQRLPRGVDGSRRIYSIFTSSEFERFALREFQSYLVHESQLEGILDVARILKESAFDGTLCIRIHPNSHDEQPSLAEALRRELDGDLAVVIPADSPVDTYALIDASEKVISFGSTVAMEAAYWGKPSVLLATSRYQNLESVYLPANRDEAVRLITDDLEAKGMGDCLKYGFYYSTFGRELRHSEVVDMNRLRFKGREVGESVFFRRVTKKALRLKRRLIGSGGAKGAGAGRDPKAASALDASPADESVEERR